MLFEQANCKLFTQVQSIHKITAYGILFLIRVRQEYTWNCSVIQQVNCFIFQFSLDAQGQHSPVLAVCHVHVHKILFAKQVEIWLALESTNRWLCVEIYVDAGKELIFNEWMYWSDVHKAALFVLVLPVHIISFGNEEFNKELSRFSAFLFT